MEISVLDLVYDIIFNVSLVFKKPVDHDGWFKVEEVYRRMIVAALFWDLDLTGLFSALAEWEGLGVVETAVDGAEATLGEEVTDDDDEVITWIRLVNEDVLFGG